MKANNLDISRAGSLHLEPSREEVYNKSLELNLPSENFLKWKKSLGGANLNLGLDELLS